MLYPNPNSPKEKINPSSREGDEVVRTIAGARNFEIRRLVTIHGEKFDR
jgi:hypothetical protein